MSPAEWAACGWTIAGLVAFVAGWALAQRRGLLREVRRLDAELEAHKDRVVTLEADLRWQGRVEREFAAVRAHIERLPPELRPAGYDVD